MTFIAVSITLIITFARSAKVVPGTVYSSGGVNVSNYNFFKAFSLFPLQVMEQT
jgi:hypothetical protein